MTHRVVWHRFGNRYEEDLTADQLAVLETLEDADVVSVGPSTGEEATTDFLPETKARLDEELALRIKQAGRTMRNAG